MPGNHRKHQQITAEAERITVVKTLHTPEFRIREYARQLSGMFEDEERAMLEYGQIFTELVSMAFYLLLAP